MKLEEEKQFNDRMIYRRKMSEETKFAIWCFVCGFFSAVICCLYYLLF